MRRLAWALLVLTLAGLMLMVALTSPRLAIRKIQVAGTRIIPAGEIIRETKYLLGSNILSVKKDRVAARLTRNPVVLAVELRRRLPRTLIVEITERTGHLVLNTGAGLYEVDRSGVAFRKVTSPSPKLPMLCCPFTGRIALGKRVRYPAFDLARDCLTGAEGKKQFHVSKISVDPDGHLCLNTREGFEVRLGRPDQLPKKLDMVARLVDQHPEFSEHGEYVDVTCFPEAPACKIRQ